MKYNAWHRSFLTVSDNRWSCGRAILQGNPASKTWIQGHIRTPKSLGVTLYHLKNLIVSFRHFRLFDWRPDKMIGERPKWEKTLIIKNLFDLALFEVRKLFIVYISPYLIQLYNASCCVASLISCLWFVRNLTVYICEHFSTDKFGTFESIRFDSVSYVPLASVMCNHCRS